MTARLAAAAALAVLAAGCAAPRRTDPAAERRAYAQMTKESAVADLDAARPGAREELDAAAGWAVFSTIGARVFLGEAPGGFGVAHDGKRGTDTYMQMSEPSLGPGLGGEEFRAVFVFRDEKTFREFVRGGWEFRTDDPGPAIEVWQLDAGGAITETALAGTKYWRDKDLN